MTWVRIHDHATRHPKILALSHPAFRLWVAALSYCQEHLTDGFVPRSALRSFGFRVSKAAISELLNSTPPSLEPLLVEVESGYEVHDFLDWNDSREEILRKRAASRARVHKHRGKRATEKTSDTHFTSSGVGVGLSGSSKEEDLEKDATAFIGWYQETAYPQYRHAAYLPANEENDWRAALALCSTYGSQRLRDLTAVWLQIPETQDPWLDGKTRTISMMKTKATAIQEKFQNEY